MAIVKMSKLTLIGLEEDKAPIIENLINMGVVEIINCEEKLADEDWAQTVNKDGDTANLAQLEADISEVKGALDYVAKYDTRKKSLFEPKRTLDDAKYQEVLKKKDTIWDTVKKIHNFNESLSALRSEENRLENLIVTLEPWKSLTVPIDVNGTRTTEVLWGVLPSSVSIESLKQELSELAPASYLQVASSDKDQTYLFILYHKDFKDIIMDDFKKFGFSKVDFRDITGTVEENITTSQQRNTAIQQERLTLEKLSATLAPEISNLEILFDYLEIEREKKKVLTNLVKTSKAFMLEGWVPTETVDRVTTSITQKYDCIIDINKPETEDDMPILVKNNSFVKPFELITDLYSQPTAKEIDPNPIMAPFYFVFFGLMLSDAGYGLLISLFTGFILWKYELEGVIRKLIGLLFYGGISTFIWGALFGGWFGNVVSAVSQGTYNIAPIWFNPLDDPMRLLMWSLIFGAIHIFVGMAVKAYMLIKDGKVVDALFDIGGWYLFLIGIVLLLSGTAGAAGKYITIAGAVVLVLTQGRSQKGIIKKLLMGVLSLYNVTSYLSDVLSYSRLLALGLATGVIATVVNTVGVLFGFNAITIVFFIIVFIIGHIFNILINVLGAYVHASRLQYVEFFSKFYNGGGRPFKPFKINTKYIKLTRLGGL